jgi:hypothetical protein
MMEVAYWKSAREFPEMKQRPLHPERVKAAVERRFIEDGPHVCGQTLCDSILACLGFKELVEGLSELEAHKTFKKKILNPLRDIGDRV